MSDKFQRMPDLTADPHIVGQLTKHLIDALNEFILGYPGSVDYMDSFMGVHNFHKFVILDLEKRTDDTNGLWRNAALATFKNALEHPTGRGDPEPE